KIEAAGLLQRYDRILFDCRPSLGVLTINAMVAADRLLIPVETHFFAVEALQTLLDVFKTVRDNLRPDLQIAGIVPTLHEPRVRGNAWPPRREAGSAGARGIGRLNRGDHPAGAGVTTTPRVRHPLRRQGTGKARRPAAGPPAAGYDNRPTIGTRKTR